MDYPTWLQRTVEACLGVTAIFGVNFYMNRSLNRRVAAIEEDKKANPGQTISGCSEDQKRCPVKLQITAIQDAIKEKDAGYVRELQNIHESIREIMKGLKNG